MAQVSELTAIQNFYQRWSPRVYGFCCLLIGDETSAEAVTAGAFRSYTGRGLELDLVKLPEELLALAWDLSKQSATREAKSNVSSEKLNEAILRLPLEERAVFILRSVMAIDELDAGSILGLPVAALRRTWFRAMLELRKLLPANFFKERSA